MRPHSSPHPSAATAEHPDLKASTATTGLAVQARQEALTVQHADRRLVLFGGVSMPMGSRRTRGMAPLHQAAYLLVGLGALSGCGGDDCSYPAAPPGAGEIVHVCAGAEDGDGSADEPYGSISEGIAAAGSGATILIAAGAYAENVAINKSLTLVGSSDPSTAAAAAAVVEAPAPYAIRIEGEHSVTLQGLRIVQPSGAGIWASNGAEVVIEGTAVQGAGEPFGYGVLAMGTSLELRS